MEKALEAIRDQQKITWNRHSPEWKKWDTLLMNSLKPMCDELTTLLQVSDDALVLDIASGTGDQGLTIARKLRNGKVVLSDLSENMLETAREKAAEAGIENVAVKICDACALPFDDNSFDAISCRLGFMFFPDLHLAADEMYRVLKPGGRFAISVWSGPEKNFWATAIGSTISQNLQLPPPPSGAPGLFRCAKPQFLKNILQQSGFAELSEKEITCSIDYGTAEVYWNMTTGVTAPLATALSKAPGELREKIKADVYELINSRYSPGKVVIEGSALVISGTKSAN